MPTDGLSLALIGGSIQTRSPATKFKDVSPSLMGLWVLGPTAYSVPVVDVPRAESKRIPAVVHGSSDPRIVSCRNFIERGRKYYRVGAHPNLAYSWNRCCLTRARRKYGRGDNA
jgi:hypothetical protein